jgi:hypothetical protein
MSRDCDTSSTPGVGDGAVLCDWDIQIIRVAAETKIGHYSEIGTLGEPIWQSLASSFAGLLGQIELLRLRFPDDDEFDTIIARGVARRAR